MSNQDAALGREGSTLYQGRSMARSPRRVFHMRTSLRSLLGGLIGLGVGLVLLLLRPTALFETIELQFIDTRTKQYVGQREPDPRIVLVEIQDTDVEALLKAWTVSWPWPLDINAYAFGVMGKAGVAAVAVDVYHLDQGAGLDDMPEGLLAELDEPTRQQLEHQEEQGRELGRAFREVGRVALAFELDDSPEWELPGRRAVAEALLKSDLLAGAPQGLCYAGANLPVLRLLEGARGLGFAVVQADEDGVVRRSHAIGCWNGRPVPGLPLATAAIATEDAVAFDGDGVRVGDARQALMADGSFLLNYRGQVGRTYPRVAPSRLIDWAAAMEETGELPAAAREALAGKIVVWGINLSGQDDLVTTTLSGAHHGPEFQATAIDNLLHGDGRVRAGAAANAVLLLVVTALLGLLSGWIRSRVLPHLLPAVLGGLVLAFTWLLFGRGMSFDVFTPLLGILLTWAATGVVRLLTEGRRNKWLEGTFGRYLAPSIIDALKEDPGLVALGGQSRHITVLFSDVAGFTRISETLGAQNTVKLLNHYLTMHSTAVMEEGGVVDKFEGDAVMAFFGDPVPSTTHAEQACRCALKVFERLPDLESVWREMGLSEFGIRIGLNTGDAYVGNMGSEQRFDYTCMGDTVNLSSRLEGANKAFGSGILIGRQTYEEAKEVILAKPLCGLIVVGRTQPEPVYELVGLRDQASDALIAHVEAFKAAVDAARRGALDEARRRLIDADATRPGDAPTRWLGGIVNQLERGDLACPWSGVVELTGK